MPNGRSFINFVTRSIAVILVFISASTALPNTNSVYCIDFYQSGKTCHSPQCIGLFDPFVRMNHNIPSGSKVIRSETTSADIDLLYKSYVKGRAQPVEFGTVEIFDRNGNLLDSTGQIMGEYHQIMLNDHLEWLVRRNSYRFDQIALIKKKHTHPQDNGRADDLKIAADQISDGDIRVDRYSMDFIKRIPELSHAKLESHIVFFRPSFLSGRTIDPILLLEDEVLVRKHKAVKVLGYRVKR